MANTFLPVDKEVYKNMTSAEREELVNAFRKEMLLASDDVQSLLDFTADVILQAHKLPSLKLDYSKIVNAINGESADPKKLENTEI